MHGRRHRLRPGLPGLGKTYPDGTTALEHVDLDVAAGDFVTVVGPSGCGKSTLLRIASGLESVTAGTMDVAAERIGYVFQDATLLPWRTVRQNVELLAELDGTPKAERAKAATAAIELVGLSGFEDHLPRAPSGGMRMRVSLARSLTLAPGLFLVKQFDTGWVYSQGVSDFSVKQQLDLKLVSNGSNAYIGDFDLDRVQKTIDIDTPIFASQATPVKAGLKAADLVTNQFIDQTIGLPNS